MQNIKAEGVPTDPLEVAILEASFAIIMQKSIDYGFEGCVAERNAIASFANYAASRTLETHKLTPCPGHAPEAVIVRGLVFALTRSIVDIARLNADPARAAHNLFHAAIAELKTLVEETMSAKQATHEVARSAQ